MLRYVQVRGKMVVIIAPYVVAIVVIICVYLFGCVFFMPFVTDFITCLKDVSVTIPSAVKRGDNALLICNYDIENDTLYAVKWYRGRREFYRYTPKENPAGKIFGGVIGVNNHAEIPPIPSAAMSINIDVSLAGSTFSCFFFFGFGFAFRKRIRRLVASRRISSICQPRQKPINDTNWDWMRGYPIRP